MPSNCVLLFVVLVTVNIIKPIMSVPEPGADNIEQVNEGTVQDSSSEIEILRERLSLLEKERQDERLKFDHELLNIHKMQAKQINVMTKTLQRDFKISGQIGEPGQKDKLTFTSLIQQIDVGRKKDIPVGEVVAAVIKAILPGLHLRSYLEGKRDITLFELCRTLRLHFREKSAAELYTCLTSAIQGPREDPQDFVVRVLDLRQKLLIAAQEEEPSKYDSALVQSLTLRTVETGIRSTAVVSAIQPLLQKELSDIDLLQTINIAMGTEAERSSKLKAKGQVNEITEQKPQVDDKLASEMAAIKEDLRTLTAQISELKVTPRPQQGARKPALCAKCRENQASSCEHCFRCGSTDHFKGGCKKRSSKPGNGNGSLQGDQ